MKPAKREVQIGVMSGSTWGRQGGAGTEEEWKGQQQQMRIMLRSEDRKKLARPCCGEWLYSRTERPD